MTTTTKQLTRIKILIEELESLRENTEKPAFDMGTWCEISEADTKTKIQKQISEAVKNPCQTAACLAGKAGLMPRFRRMGFSWRFSHFGILFGKNEIGACASFKYKEYKGVLAVKMFFGADVTKEVFMQTLGIRTLFQGINALKEFVAEEETAY